MASGLAASNCSRSTLRSRKSLAPQNCRNDGDAGRKPAGPFAYLRCRRNHLHDLRRLAAARAAERLLFSIPHFTPAACWCACTIAESMACSLSAGGPRVASVSNAASQTPSLLQREKRTTTEFQLPYRSGISRQGAPVRRTQRMRLIVRRLSATAGPRSPRSGSNGLRIRHSASVKSPRLNARLPMALAVLYVRGP
jgi:hypothetical protein